MFVGGFIVAFVLHDLRFIFRLFTIVNLSEHPPHVSGTLCFLNSSLPHLLLVTANHIPDVVIRFPVLVSVFIAVSSHLVTFVNLHLNFPRDPTFAVHANCLQADVSGG